MAVDLRVYSVDPNDGKSKLQSSTTYDDVTDVLNEVAAAIYSGSVIEAIVVRRIWESADYDHTVQEELDTLFVEEV